MASRSLTALACVLLLTIGGCAHRSGALHQLEQTLASRDSATQALRDWCGARRLSDRPEIAATPVPAPPVALPEPDRRLLEIAPGEQPGYRHVRLSCGGVVLSEAHNWYVRSRVTPAMSDQLATTDRPFGTVVAPLAFKRERLASTRGEQMPCPAGTVLSQRGLLRLPDGRPLALVVECYTAAALARPSMPPPLTS